MIVELQLFWWRIVLTAAKTEVIEGVYSTLDNDMHFLMWDFDDMPYFQIEDTLKLLQYEYSLPQIHILETKEGEGYHAYCLKAVSFQRACEILAATIGIDMRFYTAGVMRHKWTLRMGDKSGRSIKPFEILESEYKETVKIDDIKNFCTYKTPGDGHKTRIIKLGVD